MSSKCSGGTSISPGTLMVLSSRVSESLPILNHILSLFLSSHQEAGLGSFQMNGAVKVSMLLWGSLDKEVPFPFASEHYKSDGGSVHTTRASAFMIGTLVRQEPRLLYSYLLSWAHTKFESWPLWCNSSCSICCSSQPKLLHALCVASCMTIWRKTTLVVAEERLKTVLPLLLIWKGEIQRANTSAYSKTRHRNVCIHISHLFLPY